MNPLLKFDLAGYLRYIEGEFTIIYELDNCTENIRQQLEQNGNINYEFCQYVKRAYVQILSTFKKNYYITEYGVQLLAIGIFRIYTRHSNWTDTENWYTYKFIIE